MSNLLGIVFDVEIASVGASIRPRNRREDFGKIGVDDVVVCRCRGFELEFSIVMFCKDHINVSAEIRTCKN